MNPLIKWDHLSKSFCWTNKKVKVKWASSLVWSQGETRPINWVKTKSKRIRLVRMYYKTKTEYVSIFVPQSDTNMWLFPLQNMCVCVCLSKIFKDYEGGIYVQSSRNKKWRTYRVPWQNEALFVRVHVLFTLAQRPLECRVDFKCVCLSVCCASPYCVSSFVWWRCGYSLSICYMTLWVHPPC